MATRTNTEIHKKTSFGEEKIGYLSENGTIFKLRWDDGIEIGRVDATGRLFRKTKYDEQEVGLVSIEGTVHSHGLFEGGEIGWVEADGVVIQAGLILGEEEVGRVEGPNQGSAGAALLLIFLPADAEENRSMKRQ